MSEVTSGEQRAAVEPFRRGVVLWLVGIGVLLFVAMLVLGAYAPDLKSGRNGGSHALSNAATGFSGLIRLAEATGRNPTVVRREEMLAGEELAVITPDSGFDDLGRVLEVRGARTTLIVMPKWRVQADPERRGWVHSAGLLPPMDPEQTIAPGWPLKVARRKGAGRPLVAASPIGAAAAAFREPKVVQTISGDKLRPIITDQEGRILVAALSDRATYILADPDLVNNRALANPRQAAAALQLLDDLNSTDAAGIRFDVTVNGLGRSRSPLKLAFDPPFLGVTLAVFAAMLLAGWQALVRFGVPSRPERAIAFGKAALVDNSAMLIRRARRETQVGRRFAELLRERAAERYRLPAGLTASEQEERLDRLRPGAPFSALAAAVQGATSRAELVASARALQGWNKETSA